MVPSWRGHGAPVHACPPGYGEGVNASQVFIVVALAWGLLGVATALVMGRRGHQPFMWLMLGIVFGPLVLPLALNALHQDRPGLLERLSSGRRGTGSVDVLAGIDGSPEAESACRSAIHMLGSRLRRLTLTAVVDYDVAVGSGLAEENERARAGLMRTADATGLRPETLLLSGRPAEVLRKYAVEGGYDLIVVGRRGHGASRVLLGSVADALARGGEVPVLIV